MLLFAHLGIGNRIARFLSRELLTPWIYLGTLLPDVIDKPLYYLCALITGEYGADVGLISGTRTFGHSGLLLLLIAGYAWRGSKKCTSLSLGILTHLLLDMGYDYWKYSDTHGSALALFFPLMGFKFYASPYRSLSEHWHHKLTMPLITLEMVGALFLLHDAYKSRKRT